MSGLRPVSSLDHHFTCAGAVLAGTVGLVCNEIDVAQ